MQRHGAWIDVLPFNGRETIIRDSNTRVELENELKDYCETLWAPKKKEGWASSWVAYANRISFLADAVEIRAGAMPFHLVDGSVKSIEEEKPFAPKQSYVPCLSVGFPTATKDGKVIFQRRPENVHVPNTLIHEPCGYMSSKNFAPGKICDDERYAGDSRLFNLETQLNFRRREIANTFGLLPEQVSYEMTQDFIGLGWKSLEMYFSTIGKINANESELKTPEKGEFFFVPFENLKQLIYNQGKLSKVNPDGYRPANAEDIPMIDESLMGLIYGYERMTGEKLDVNETVERLNFDGMNIKIHDTSPGRVYAPHQGVKVYSKL